MMPMMHQHYEHDLTERLRFGFDAMFEGVMHGDDGVGVGVARYDTYSGGD